MKSKIEPIKQDKKFEPINLVITIENLEELEHLVKIFGGTKGHGTFEIYDQLEEIEKEYNL